MISIYKDKVFASTVIHLTHKLIKTKGSVCETTRILYNDKRVAEKKFGAIRRVRSIIGMKPKVLMIDNEWWPAVRYSDCLGVLA